MKRGQKGISAYTHQHIAAMLKDKNLAYANIAQEARVCQMTVANVAAKDGLRHPRGRRRGYTLMDAEHVKNLRDLGFTWERIEHETGIAHSTAARMCEFYG